MFRNKKALTELVSFILLLLVIVIASSSAYLFAKNKLEDNIGVLDHNNMEINLKKLNLNLNSIENFDNAQISSELNFRKGSLLFENNQVKYYSLVESNTNQTFCFNNLCYVGEGGYELLFFNLSNYTFKKNYSLLPGNYILSFRNIKNESKIEIIFP